MPPTVRKYRAVPVSGFFLMHQTLRGVDAFAEGMRATYVVVSDHPPFNILPHPFRLRTLYSTSHLI